MAVVIISLVCFFAGWAHCYFTAARPKDRQNDELWQKYSEMELAYTQERIAHNCWKSDCEKLRAAQSKPKN